MSHRALSIALTLTLGFVAGTAVGTAAAQDATAASAIASLSEPVTPTTLLENAETRLVKVDILANATRAMHGHPDMQFHVFITTEWPIILTIQGQARPVLLGKWQAHFFKGGTVHSITNPNSTPASFLEFFTKKTAASASLDPPDPADATAAAMAALAAIR